MAELTPPFDYVNILIGEEIIYRALVQQEQFAQQGQYGAEWTEQDQIEKSAAYFKSNVLRADFSIPSQYQQCVPYPPCPWDKQEDKIETGKIKPVLTGNDGVYTFTFGVFVRIDQQNSYTIGAKIIDYPNDQSQLAPTVRSEFSYFNKNQITPYLGTAAFVVERFNRGTKDREFRYIFDLIA